jgi:inorganic pyrophosphatase
MNTEQWVDVVIEIPRGSRNKYEFDHKRHIFQLDRVLYSSVHYPTDYSFIEETLANDGDPLDVLVFTEEPTFPGCHLRARPVGTLRMQDEKGSDEKILAVPVDDPRFKDINKLTDLPIWKGYIPFVTSAYASCTLMRKKEANGITKSGPEPIILRIHNKSTDEVLMRY